MMDDDGWESCLTFTIGGLDPCTFFFCKIAKFM